jgi:flavin reductase (DIM6/NTAB) family NADH-FMN oxidoreductase RutF
LQGYLQGSVGPRPIAFASTVDADGNPNLSPLVSLMYLVNPPILVFSPARRVRDNSVKHTLINCEATREVVINVVNYDLVQQTSLASTEYADGVNEFIKSGVTPVPSDLVKPFRVQESGTFECKVTQIIALGDEGGAGNLILCEVVKYISMKQFLTKTEQSINIKLIWYPVLAANWYSRSNQGLFEVPKPLATLGIE